MRRALPHLPATNCAIARAVIKNSGAEFVQKKVAVFRMFCGRKVDIGIQQVMGKFQTAGNETPYPSLRHPLWESAQDGRRRNGWRRLG